MQCPREGPLEAYISEVVQHIESEPDARELQVQNVKVLRYAEAHGEYDQVVPR